MSFLKNITTAPKTVIAYIIFSTLWILLSDRILFLIVVDTELIEQYSIVKGLVFVLISALLIYLIIKYSAEKQSETLGQLEMTETQFKGILDSALDGIITVDESELIMLFNPAAERIFGYQASEIIGKPVHLLLPQHLKKGDSPKGIKGIADAIERTMGSLDGMTGVRMNGEEFPIEASISESSVQGKKLLTIILRDATDRMKHERTLQESEERMRMLVEGVKEYAIIMLDTQGDIVSWNNGAKKITGYDVEEIIGKHFSLFFPKNDDTYSGPDEILRIASTSGYHAQEGTLIRKRGGEFIASIVITALSDFSGKSKGYSAILRDISEMKQSEEHLRQEKQFTDTLLDTLPGIFYFFDSRGKFLRWNKNFELVSGYSFQEIELKQPTDFFPDEEHKNVIDRIQAVFKDGEAALDGSFVTKRGVKIPYYFTGKKIVHRGDDCIIGMGIDVSGIKKIEQALRASEERYRELVEHSPMMIGIISAGEIVFMNNAGCHILGAAAPESIAGESIISFIREDCVKALQTVLEQTIGSAAKERIPIVIRRADGEEKIVEITSLLFAWQGKNAQLIIGQDITEQRKAEETAEMLEHKLYNTLESMTDAFVSLDTNWRYTFMNQSAGKIFARDPKQLIGKHIWTEFPEGIGQPFHLAYEKAMTEQRFIWMEEYYPPYDRWFENRIYPSAEGISIFFHDITDRKKLEIQLNETNLRLQELADYLQTSIEEERARISREIHDDLGQAIAALRIDMSMLNKSIQQSQDSGLKESAAKDIAEMTQMIDGMVLAMRKIIRDLRPEVLDTLGIVGGLRWLAEEFERRTKISCSASFPSGEMRIDAKRSTTLFRIVQESLTNIMRHANASKVEISLTINEEWLTLRVTDDGKGISENDKIKSHSFGLLGMQERLRAFKGTMNISGQKGSGTVLTVLLPIQQEIDG